jgi:uncharacterized membrane protein
MSELEHWTIAHQGSTSMKTRLGINVVDTAIVLFPVLGAGMGIAYGIKHWGVLNGICGGFLLGFISGLAAFFLLIFLIAAIFAGPAKLWCDFKDLFKQRRS